MNKWSISNSRILEIMKINASANAVFLRNESGMFIHQVGSVSFSSRCLDAHVCPGMLSQTLSGLLVFLPDDNLADEPSREYYKTLWRLKARQVVPLLDASFKAPQTWQPLSFACVRGLKRAVSPDGCS